jgi:uncharacterized integral membrane protein
MSDTAGPGGFAGADEPRQPPPYPPEPLTPPGALLQPDQSLAPGGVAPTAPADDAPGLQIVRTRASTTYAGVGVGLLVLIVVLVFVVQNLHEATVHFITLRFKLPQGVIVLAGAIAGGLIVLLVSLARVIQLRLAARRHTRQHARPGR